jgi:ribosomal protein S18 acetylase RimI-like enzyme
MNDITISLATRRDRKQLINWFLFYGNEKLAGKRAGCYLEYHSTLIAKDKNRIIGVLQWHVQENPACGLSEIEEVLIDEKYRSRGIGDRLVAFAITGIRDYFKELNIRPRKVFLFVGKENLPARNLYEKHGFRLMNSVGNLFHDAREELFYALDL